MRQLSVYLPPLAGDYSGVCSALFDYNCLILIQDAACCTRNYVDYDDDGNQILPVSVQIEKNEYNWYTYNSYRKGWSYDQWSPNFGSYDYGNTYYSLSVSLASNDGSTVKASTRGENSAIVHYYSSGWGFSNREAYKQGTKASKAILP